MKRSRSEAAFDAAVYAVVAALIMVILYPLLHVLAAAFSEPARLAGHRGFLLWPLGFSVEPFRLLFRNPLIARSFLNTMVMLGSGVAVNVLMTAVGAYVLSRKGVRLVKPATVFIVVTMVFSGGLIPFYLTVKGLGLINSFSSLVFPFAINTMNLIILRTAFEGVPASLEESAKLDGAGHFTILFRIMLPVVLPTLAVVLLYYIVERWNGWFYASIFLKDRNLYTLQLVLREILIINDVSSMTAGGETGDFLMLSQSIKYAAIVVGTAPVLALYPFLQRYFVKGTLVGAVKG